MNDRQKLIVIRKILDYAWKTGNENGEFFNGILSAIDAVMQVKEGD